jgi:hypothetical protein
LRRGQQDGPVVATVEACEDKQGSSDVKLADAVTISLEHVPRWMLVLPPKTTFTIDGKKQYWKGCTDLFEEATNKLVAQYTPIEAEGKDDKTGELLITEDQEAGLRELVVIGSITLQQRAEARKRAVLLATFYKLVIYIGT